MHSKKHSSHRANITRGFRHPLRSRGDFIQGKVQVNFRMGTDFSYIGYQIWVHIHGDRPPQKQ